VTGQGQPSRKRVLVEPADERRILRALEAWAESNDFIALRTRAFIYLLWDGAIRTRPAVHLNAEELVRDPGSSRIEVVEEVTQRACEANRYRTLHFFLSTRARSAIADYLRAVRKGLWLPTVRLQGPLFLSSRDPSTPTRMSARTAVHSWQTFLSEHGKPSREYQLDDVVYSGRVAFLRAAKGDSSLLSGHANLQQRSALQYRAELELPSGSTREVLDRLHKQSRHS